jgi:hypothetical protein
MTLGERAAWRRWEVDRARWAHLMATKAAAEQARLAALRDAGQLELFPPTPPPGRARRRVRRALRGCGTHGRAPGMAEHG